MFGPASNVLPASMVAGGHQHVGTNATRSALNTGIFATFSVVQFGEFISVKQSHSLQNSYCRQIVVISPQFQQQCFHLSYTFSVAWIEAPYFFLGGGGNPLPLPSSTLPFLSPRIPAILPFILYFPYSSPLPTVPHLPSLPCPCP